MKQENKQVIDTILESINIMVKNLIEKASFNVTRWATITTVNVDGTYDISMDGKDYSSIKSDKDIPIPVNTTVEIAVPNNQYNRMYIVNKIKEKNEGDKTYVFVQDFPKTTWNITHNLNKYPSVTIQEATGTEILTDIDYVDLNTIILNFPYSVQGKAFLN